MTRTSQEVMEVLFEDPSLIKAAQDFEKNMDNDQIIPMIRLEPYVRETLEILKNRYHIAIATNRGKSLPLVLEFHQLVQYFDLTVSSAEVRQPKPHPEYLELILQEFSLAPGQALYVGDAEVDAQLAAGHRGPLPGLQKSPPDSLGASQRPSGYLGHPGRIIQE